MSLKDRDIHFLVLGGTTYSRENRPPCWYNETSLLLQGDTRLSMKFLPLHLFPLFEDFEVILEKIEVLGANGSRRCPFGYQIRFFSKSRGYLADFPWWDHAEQDLRREGFIIPFGNDDHPYEEVEQGYQIVITRYENCIYILQGNFDRIQAEDYHTWFKVPEQRYMDQWQKAIQACRQLNAEL